MLYNLDNGEFTELKGQKHYHLTIFLKKSFVRLTVFQSKNRQITTLQLLSQKLDNSVPSGIRQIPRGH